MMAHVDLCSGIGGFGYGFETVGLSKPVLFCEIDPWCRKVLKKHWPDVPQCEDVKELADDPDRYVPRNLDWSNTIVSGGYPCQAFSVGAPHKRERLWIVAHSNSNSQSDVTKHEQERLVANTESERHRGGSSEERGDEQRIVFTSEQKGSSVGSEAEGRSSSHGADVADTSGEGLEGGQQLRQHTKENGRRQEGAHGSVAQCCDDGAGQTADSTAQPRMGHLASGLSKGLDRFGKHDGFEVEPADIPRVASGIKDRANRLKGLGNAIVPQIAMQIGLAIKETQWK